jgi:hypothetical protein
MTTFAKGLVLYKNKGYLCFGIADLFAGVAVADSQ